MLSSTGRLRLEDLTFDDDESGADYTNRLLIRLSAKKKRFESVDFSFTTFDACYFRDCVFVSCKFVGCRFLSVNFRGSSFAKCQFEYSTFDKTLIANDILHRESPQYENLKAEFARTLRTNFQQMGDARSVNMAIHVELDATKAHLRNAWASAGSYYRDKYSGTTRFIYFLRWLSFRILDLLWGNGESAWKLLRTVAVLVALMAFFGGFRSGNPLQLQSYRDSLVDAPSIFLGILSGSALPRWYLTIITAIRLVMFGAFVSILTKRLSRR
jgi:hypothetical protein